MGKKFPLRRGAVAYHGVRKLWAKGFLSDVGPWRIKVSGNYGQKVSSPAWGRGVSKRQETMGKKFPLRLGAMAYQSVRKLWAKSFLSDVGPWRIKASGNYGQKVSSPAWGHGVSWQQETMGKRLRVRLGAMAYHGVRKLWAKSFLSDVGPWRIKASGNYGQKVSSPAWGRGVSWQQETMGKRFPLRLRAVAYQSVRKLWAKGFLSGLGPWRIMASGNYG